MTEMAGAYRQRALDATEIRTLIHRARTSLVPDRLAARLRSRYPVVLEADAGEVADLLAPIAQAAAAELTAAGIGPGREGIGGAGTSRERSHVVALSAVYAWLARAAQVAGRPLDAIEASDAAVAWVPLGRNPLQEAVCRRVAADLLWMSDPKQTLDHIDVAIDAARRCDDRCEEFRAALQRAMFLLRPDHIDEAEAIVRGLMARFDELPDHPRSRTIRGMTNRVLGDILTKGNRHEEALRYFTAALEWIDEEYDPYERAITMQLLGIFYDSIDHYQSAVEMLLQSIRLVEEAGHPGDAIWSYTSLADVYHRLGEFDNALDAIDRAQRQLVGDSVRNAEVLASLEVSRADLLIGMGRHEEARTVLEPIVSREATDARLFYLVAAHALMAVVERRSGNNEPAKFHCCRALEISTNSAPATRLRLKLRLAEVERDLGNPDAARALLEEIDAELPRSTVRVRALRLRANLEEDQDRIREALAIERRAAELDRELLREGYDRSIRNARMVSETGLLQRGVALEREKRARVEHELAEALIALRRQREEVSVMLDELESAVRSGPALRSPEDARLIGRLRRRMRAHVSRQDTGVAHVSMLGDEFFVRLRERYPDLTPKQERLCALIRAGLATEEIESLMELSHEGLKSHRKRLRRRLGLSAGDSLEATIAAV